MPLRRLTATALAGVLSIGLVTAGSGSASATPRGKTVDQLVDKRITNPRLGSSVGLLAIDAATGEIVSDHDSDRRMLPASNMKVVTAVTSLASLGADHRFTTRVRSGSQPGELILEGGGDPLLSTKELRRLATQTAATLPPGTPVTVYVDDNLFPSDGRGPGWTTGYIPSVVSSVHSLGRLWDYSSDPSANAAAVFAKKLRAKGFPVTVAGAAEAGDAPIVAESKGHTVDEAVRIMLRVSENNVAEVLYRQVALAAGQPGDWSGARTAAEQVLAGLGIDTSRNKLLDGSGLSRRNRVTPKFLVDVLRTAKVTNPEPFRVMFEEDAMPVAGISGTLDDRYGRFVTKRARCAAGDVKAKTGTLFDTISLSGVTASDGSPERIFSILVNKRPKRFSALTVRQAVDGLTATIAGCWR
jgi:D-alanyl-D-alanine carboxypeptidase/D-alanyl-D-alanine-endopeptidase (penicillin-binding protein 4)